MHSLPNRPAGIDPRADSGPVRAIALIPARLASTRLPRKMLLEETGLPLVVHTARNVAASGLFARVAVAVDADEVEQAVRVHGFEAIRTRVEHPSGTDRVREAWELLAAGGEHADVLVGVQGDEPDLEADDLARLVAAFADPAVEMATLCAPLDDARAFEAGSVVKVVRDTRGDALYFSRAPIPAAGHDRGDARAPILRHVGVYAYRPKALVRFTELPRGVLEQRESLEQLRWLEAGFRMRVVDARRAPRGIDTLEDYRAFVTRTRADPSGSAREARANASVAQREYAAVAQRVNAAVPQRVNAAVPQRVNAAVPQRVNAAVPQRVNAAVPQRVNAAVPQRVNADSGSSRWDDTGRGLSEARAG